MNRKAAIVLLFVGLGIGLWAAWTRAHRHDYANFPPTAAGPWVAFGDSLTEGFGASEGHDYPALLGQRLGVKIANLGRTGDTADDALKRLEEVAQLRPRVVLLCLGGNDELQKLARAQMFANLGRAIDRLHQEGSFVVLIGIRSASLRDRNESDFRALAKRKKVHYVANILRGIFPNPAYMSDALHPNDAGYRFIAERLEKELRPLLPQLQAPPSSE